MAKKKPAKKAPSKKAPAKPRKPVKKTDPAKPHLDYLEGMVNGPGSNSDKINDVLAYLSDKSMSEPRFNFVRSICQQAETNTEKVQLLAAYFKTV